MLADNARYTRSVKRIPFASLQHLLERQSIIQLILSSPSHIYYLKPPDGTFNSIMTTYAVGHERTHSLRRAATGIPSDAAVAAVAVVAAVAAVAAVLRNQDQSVRMGQHWGSCRSCRRRRGWGLTTGLSSCSGRRQRGWGLARVATGGRSRWRQ